MHYLSTVQFPITHPNCHFHRFPWPESKTETLFFWAVFHWVAPILLIGLWYKYKITHLFAFGYSYGYMMQPLRIFKKLPLAIFMRGDAFQKYRMKQLPYWILALEKAIEGIAINGTNLYGVSKALNQSVISRHKIFKPLKAQIFRNDICKRPDFVYRTPDFPLRLGCVGILEKLKNQDLLLDMMKHIRADEAILCIYGVGEDLERLKAKAEKIGVDNRVFFKGWVPSNLIWKNIDLLLMSSKHEGCPNAVLEALQSAIPVLASNISAHRELLPISQLLPFKDVIWSTRVKEIVKAPEREIENIIRDQYIYSEKLHFNWDQEICKRILG